MKLFRRSTAPSASWHCAFIHKGRKYQYSTKTDDPALAKQRAEAFRTDIFRSVREGAATTPIQARHIPSAGTPTLAEIIAAYKELAVDNNEHSRYCCSLALLRVASASRIGEHDRIDRLNESTWQKYRAKAIAGLEGDALASAKRTANSNMLQAKAVFTKSLMQQYRRRFDMPDMTPFTEMLFFKQPAPRFQAVPKAVLLAAEVACREAGKDYENAFNLGLWAGLRRKEITLARWDWISDTGNGSYILRVPGAISKNKDSRNIPLSATLVAKLHKIDAELIAPAMRSCPFRERLNSLLRSKGIVARKPLHELRKQFGAMVATSFGLYAAQKLLGHSSPELTSSIYSDLVSLPQPLDAKLDVA